MARQDTIEKRLNFRVSEPVNDNAARKFAALHDTALLTDLGNIALQKICAEFTDFFKSKILQVKNFTAIPTEKGSLSNDYAILAASQMTGGKAVLASNFAHKSIQQSCQKQKLDLIEIPCDAEYGYAVSARHFAEAIRLNADKVGVIVITIGVTAHGKLSDLPIAEVQEYVLKQRAMGRNIWLHVDAAFGYMEILRTRNASIRHLMQHADSWTVNPHKWFGPKGLSLVGFKDGKLPKLSDQKYFAGANTIFGSSQSGYAIAAAWHILRRPGSVYKLERTAKQVHANAHKLAAIFTNNGFKLLCTPETRILAVDLSHSELSGNKSCRILGEHLKNAFMAIGVDMDICDIDGHHSLRFTLNPVPKKLFHEKLRAMENILGSLFVQKNILVDNISYLAQREAANDAVHDATDAKRPAA